MLRTLRQQVQKLLYAVAAQRKPALRRCDDPDALLATDLPLIAEQAAVDAFCREMTEQGWTIKVRAGWLVLDAPIPAPAAEIPSAPQGECGCCISLMMRHPERADAEEWLRAVIKAADAGRASFERVCGRLHTELAIRLRKHEPLPGMLLPYICQAYHTFYDIKEDAR